MNRILNFKEKEILMRKLLAFLLTILLLGMMLAGCGGDGDTDGESTAAEEGNMVVEEPAAEESQEMVGDAEAGKAHYDSVCVACHGVEATGLPNLGKDLTNSEFTQNLTDEELVEFIKMGRSVGDPENTTGVDMPPKGGSPALSDQGLYDIVAYLRTLEQ
jgi:disulfide bond formation protein DsbB